MRKLWLLPAVLLLAFGLASILGLRAEHTARSAVGVELSLGSDGRSVDLGNLTAEAIADKLGALADSLRVEPVDPTIESVNSGLIPGLAGWELDVPATATEVMGAEPNSLVQPKLHVILPRALTEYATYPIYHGNPAKRQIALVINVAWGNEYLPEMLQILSEADVKASFFLVGRWVDQNADLVQQIAALGHEFGNHAYSDPHLPQLDRTRIAEEITRTSDAIEQITGHGIKYFSPPYNDFNQTVLDTAADLGYLTVLCSLDTADWMRPGVERIVRRIVPRAHPGAIVLMHPTEQTPAALRQIVAGLQQQGYQLVTISELLDPEVGAEQTVIGG